MSRRETGPFERSLFIVLALLVLAAPLSAQTTEEDPRDQKIRKLQEQLDSQSQQIEELRKALEELKNSSSAPAGPEPAVTLQDDEDPGPEPPPPLEAGTNPPSPSGTGQQAVMNPNISVIGLFEGKAGGADYDPTRDSFYMREIEVALQAPIDPYARADIYLTWPHDETPEVEEATLTWTGLPAGLQAKAGLLRADIGRINQLHTHALPQIDTPLPNAAIFGPESLRDPGVELSWLAPTSWYSRFSVQTMTRSVGENADGFTTFDPTDPAYRQSLQELLADSSEFSLYPAGGKGLLTVGRWENLFDLNEDTTLGFGVSGSTAHVGAADLQRASSYGADVTLKWRPLDNPYTSLVWQTEFLHGHQAYSADTRDFAGWYTFLNYQWNRNWSAGARYDMTELPFDPSLEHRRASALLEYTPSEWNRLRLQYNHNWTNYNPTFDELLFQWNIVLGPHGAHKY